MGEASQGSPERPGLLWELEGQSECESPGAGTHSRQPSTATELPEKANTIWLMRK